VKVRVVRVDLEASKIDFVLVEGGPAAVAHEGEMPHAVPVAVTKPRDQDKKQSRLETQAKDGGRGKKGRR
jgi:hypothetical protein